MPLRLPAWLPAAAPLFVAGLDLEAVPSERPLWRDFHVCFIWYRTTCMDRVGCERGKPKDGLTSMVLQQNSRVPNRAGAFGRDT